MDCKNKPVYPKGNRSWIFIGRTDAETEALILWPPDGKSLKDPLAGKDWGQEEKGTTEDEMVGWHHRLNGHEFEQTLGDSEEKGKSDVLYIVHGVAKSWTWLNDWDSHMWDYYYLRVDNDNLKMYIIKSKEYTLKITEGLASD